MTTGQDWEDDDCVIRCHWVSWCKGEMATAARKGKVPQSSGGPDVAICSPMQAAMPCTSMHFLFSPLDSSTLLSRCSLASSYSVLGAIFSSLV